jgi:hypothetical protein
VLALSLPIHWLPVDRGAALGAHFGLNLRHFMLLTYSILSQVSKNTY